MGKISNSELEKAQILINEKPPGVYELKDIYGKKWISIYNPTEFGMHFKEEVEGRKLEGISVGEKKSNNHQTYIIS